MMLAGVFAIFLPALVLPGPDFVAVVRASMTRGAGAGLWTTAGVAAGLGFYATLSLAGLSAILAEYQWLALTIRVAGALYLGWLGLTLVFARRGGAEAEFGGDAGAPRGHPLVFGFLVTLTNPKAIVLFASVFATAVTEATPAWLMALMVALVVASALAWYSAVSLFLASAPVAARFRAARRRIERAAGVCFVAISGKLLADARSPIGM